MIREVDPTADMVIHFQDLAERDKAALARELHDDLGGMLIGAVMDLAILAPQFLTFSEDVQKRILRVRQTLGSAINLTRRFTEELRPTLLDNVGLFAALRWQLKNSCAKTKVHCTHELPEAELTLKPYASIALFRSAQEALVVGLARDGVTKLAIAGTLEDGTLSIRIAGNGNRLSERTNDLINLTLESIRHRIRALGGAVVVEHPASGGVVLGLITPVKNVVRIPDPG